MSLFICQEAENILDSKGKVGYRKSKVACG